MALNLMRQLVADFSKGYTKNTTQDVKIIDAYLVFCIAVGVLTIVFCVLAGSTFPFNSFLAAIWTTIGAFALGASLRMQVVAPSDFSGRNPNAAFRDFVLCNLLLFICAWNYIG